MNRQETWPPFDIKAKSLNPWLSGDPGGFLVI